MQLHVNMFGLVTAVGNSTPSSHTHTRDKFPLELINTEWTSSMNLMISTVLHNGQHPKSMSSSSPKLTEDESKEENLETWVENIHVYWSKMHIVQYKS